MRPPIPYESCGFINFVEYLVRQFEFLVQNQNVSTVYTTRRVVTLCMTGRGAQKRHSRTRRNYSYCVQILTQFNGKLIYEHLKMLLKI